MPKSTDPLVLRMGELILELVDEDGDPGCLVEVMPQSVPEKVDARFIHSPGCMDACEYACGGVFVTRSYDDEHDEWLVTEVEG